MVTRIVAEFENSKQADRAVERIMTDVHGIYSANIVQKPAVSAVTDKPLQAIDSVAEEAKENVRKDTRTSLYIVCDGSRSDEIYSLIATMGGLNMA